MISTAGMRKGKNMHWLFENPILRKHLKENLHIVAKQ